MLMIFTNANCLACTADVAEDWSEGQPVSGVKYKAADGSIREARAHLTIVCDGMYSNFRKPLTESADVHHPSFFVGLLLRNVQLPYANHGHVVLAEPSPVLFYPISPTEVRAAAGIWDSVQCKPATAAAAAAAGPAAAPALAAAGAC
jgi:2-polyprenyl-6-methoxyphenol hydroxylase-like FAD-dependent oxidoreductase